MYHNLAFTTWLISFFWLTQKVVRGIEPVEEPLKVIWSILIPHFTEKGIQSFKDFFGESYFESLGEAFSTTLAKYQLF